MWLLLILFPLAASADEPIEAPIATLATDGPTTVRAGQDGITLGMELLLEGQQELDDLEVLSINVDRGIDAPRQSVLDLRDETWDSLFGSHVLEVERGLDGGPRSTWSNTATAQNTVRGRDAVEGLCVEAGARPVSGELDLVVQPRGTRHPDTASDRSLRRARPAFAFWTGQQRRKAGTHLAAGESVTVVQVITGDTHGQPDTRLDVQSDDWQLTVHEGDGASQVCVSYGSEASVAPSR